MRGGQEQNLGNGGIERNLEDVEVTSAARAALRDPAGGTLAPSGRLQMNANATEMWIEAATARGLDPATAAAKLQADKANNAVIVVPVVGGTAGTVRVILRQDDQLGVATHLFSAFKKLPNLKPTGNRSVLILKEYDKEGKPYLVVDLQTAMVKPKGKRGSSDDSTDGEKPAEKAK